MPTDKDMELARLASSLTESFARWDFLLQNGGSDPYWPDGFNMNLVRNHIISYKKQIEALMDQESEEISLFSRTYPDVYYRETPDEVSDDYMSKADEIRARANQQIVLYENDPNFRYCLENHDKVFPGGETKATKAAGLHIHVTAILTRYRYCIEKDNLVDMRCYFREPYEKKAPEWAKAAQDLKNFLSKEHDPKDDVIVKDPNLEDELEGDFEEQPIPASEKPVKKPSLFDQIQKAQATAEIKKPSVKQHEEQVSFF